MPHKCVRCSTVYPNNSPELMRGCNCGSRVFLFMRDPNAPALPAAPATPSTLDASLPSNPSAANVPSDASAPTPPSAFPAPSPTDERAVEPDPLVSEYGWLEDELAFLSKDKPVSVDVDAVENLRILEKGAYEIDLPSLFKGEPLVIKSDQHVYYVKLPAPRK